jgi:hypothetical protein
MNELPMADAATPEDLAKVRKQVANRNLVSASNNTKWNELITFFRGLPDWRPSYRSKWVTGHISGWDTEWSYHLPFPFIGVEWFDIGLHQHSHTGRLVPPQVTDHSPIILSKLNEIGFEYEVRQDVVRIWGYLPKSYEDFPPNPA